MDKLTIFFLFFPEIGFDITCKGNSLHELSYPIFGENKKGKRKVHAQTQAAALPRHQEEEETDKNKQAQVEQTY